MIVITNRRKRYCDNCNGTIKVNAPMHAHGDLVFCSVNCANEWLKLIPRRKHERKK